MLKKIKKIISKIDLFLFKKFGSEKNIKFLENLKEAKIIFSYLNEMGKENKVRFVGGCVRKVLCGDNVDDIDLSTSLEPNEVKKRLARNNIKVIDTGISHGTVTAIINKKNFEITTLRQDIFTDGRHAKVQFTSDWKQDALRRDFTINAIYADIDGQIFDPLSGISDLIKGTVKFIGNPVERIQEDYLRILRYFRFFSHYSKIAHEDRTIQAIKSNIDGLNKIAQERKFDELQKICKLKNVNNLFLDHTSRNVFLIIFPQLKHYNRLKRLQELNKATIERLDELFILALLVVDSSDNYEYFCHKYKTSRKIKDRFSNIANNLNALKNKDFLQEKNIKKYLYFNSKDSVFDLLLFAFFINDQIQNLDLEESLKYLQRCNKPAFPISGNYLKEKGIESGEHFGKIMKKLENAWISNNFSLDENAINKIIKK